jgi:prepilin peptidase CpaA
LLSLQTFVMLQKVIAFAAIALLAAAAYGDIKTFRIPNALVGTIAALGIFRLILLADPIVAIYAVSFGLLSFLIGLVLFSRGIVGGGDVKLLTATILLIRYRDLYEFVALMSVAGALLSVAILIHNHRPLVSEPRLPVPKTHLPVPYGVAIAAAGIVTLLLQPLLYRYALPVAPTFLW